MQFKINNDGYTIGEKYRLESKSKLLKLDGDATFTWGNAPVLKIDDKSTVEKYFAQVGQEFWALYKSAVKSWEKFAQATLDKAEKSVLAMSKSEAKKMKGSSDPRVKAAAEGQIKSYSEQQAGKVATEIQARFEAMMPDLSKKAHETVVKKLGKAAGALKKNHGKAVLKAVMFTVAVVAVVLATIALGPLAGAALGIGIAAVVIKSVGVLTKGVGDLRSYLKEWNSISQRAGDEIDKASEALTRAVTAMESCNNVRQSLQIKVASAQTEIAKIGSGLEGSDKKIAALKKQAAAAEKELKEVEAFLGTDVAQSLKQIKDANSILTKAKAKKPRKILSNVEKVMDLVSAVGDAA